MDPISVTCPRCRTTGEERFYGPCSECRAQLRATVAGVAKQVEVAAYEPKMNVVPNQIATKG